MNKSVRIVNPILNTTVQFIKLSSLVMFSANMRHIRIYSGIENIKIHNTYFNGTRKSNYTI